MIECGLPEWNAPTDDEYNAESHRKLNTSVNLPNEDFAVFIYSTRLLRSILLIEKYNSFCATSPNPKEFP